MKSITEKLTHKSSYTVNDLSDCGFIIHAAVDNNGNAGVVIGGVFELNAHDDRIFAENSVKKLGFNIAYSVDDFKSDNPEAAGYTRVAYFINTGTSESAYWKRGATKYVNCYNVGSDGIQILNMIN